MIVEPKVVEGEERMDGGERALTWCPRDWSGVLSGEQEGWSVEASKVKPSSQGLGSPKPRFKFCGPFGGSV